MGAKTVKSRSAAGKNKAFNGNFKQGELRSWSISSKNRKRRWHMSLLAQSWRQNTAEAMTTQRWKWSCPSKSRLVKRKGHCLSFLDAQRILCIDFLLVRRSVLRKPNKALAEKHPGSLTTQSFTTTLLCFTSLIKQGQFCQSPDLALSAFFVS